MFVESAEPLQYAPPFLLCWIWRTTCHHGEPAVLNTESPCCKHSNFAWNSNHKLKTPNSLILWKFSHFQKTCFSASSTFWSAWYKGLERTVLLMLADWVWPSLSQSFCVRHAEWVSKKIWWWGRRSWVLSFCFYMILDRTAGYISGKACEIGLQGFIIGELLHTGTLRI